MENKNIYNDDVERIVNDPERQKGINAFHEKRQKRKQLKMLVDAVVYAAIAIAVGLLGCVGCMTAWIAFLVCAAGGLYSAFCFCRWVGNGKGWGGD